MRQTKFRHLFIYVLPLLILFTGCKKFLEIAPPITTLTTGEIFSTNKQAEWAISGIYSKMINGTEATTAGMNSIAIKNFAAGLSTITGGYSADELINPIAGNSFAIAPILQNKLTAKSAGYSTELWTSAYKVIYESNAVIEGIAASSSSLLMDSVRNQITGEALALRAFSYFYLVNYFGELPLALVSDFNETVKLSRSPVNKVYDQIKADLVKAKSLLSADFSVGNNERVRINKWFAEALLARVYLFTGEYQLAVNSATAVINQTGLFSIEPVLSNVFLKNSKEAILQLKPTNEDRTLKSATPEGHHMIFFPSAGNTTPSFALSNNLSGAFEAGDKRKTEWTQIQGGFYAPAKYKAGARNTVQNGPQTEYYMVMRLAELYLIRAEAALLLSPANKNDAIADLNVLRKRADIDLLNNTLTADEVKIAVEQERRIELFAEWGHRWFDLKRAGKAEDVLSNISYKQPWLGDYQFLYPIPLNEIKYNSRLSQNPLYYQ